MPEIGSLHHLTGNCPTRPPGHHHPAPDELENVSSVGTQTALAQRDQIPSFSSAGSTNSRIPGRKMSVLNQSNAHLEKTQTPKRPTLADWPKCLINLVPVKSQASRYFGTRLRGRTHIAFTAIYRKGLGLYSL